MAAAPLVLVPCGGRLNVEVEIICIRFRHRRFRRWRFNLSGRRPFTASRQALQQALTANDGSGVGTAGDQLREGRVVLGANPRAVLLQQLGEGGYLGARLRLGAAIMLQPPRHRPSTLLLPGADGGLYPGHPRRDLGLERCVDRRFGRGQPFT